MNDEADFDTEIERLNAEMWEKKKTLPAVVIPNASAVGIDFPEFLTFDQWLAYATYVAVAERACHWWLGDLLNAAENWGYLDQAIQAAHELGFADQTCANAKSVAARWPMARRIGSLSYSHHAALA